MADTRGLKLIGPFKQIVSMTEMSLKGPLKDEDLIIIENGGIVVNEQKIVAVDNYSSLAKNYSNLIIEEPGQDAVALPGLIDAHTHICYAGSRAGDFAARNSGKSYLEIAEAGGGIWSTVQHTRNTEKELLIQLILSRLTVMASNGITTCEIKSGYGLNPENEIKMLEAIHSANAISDMDLVATCLAAHMVPRYFPGSEEEYLQLILDEIVPLISARQLCKRFDIFIEKNAFTPEAARNFLLGLKKLNFEYVVHGDQFTTGGSRIAVETAARSVDHLEVSGEKEIKMIAKSNTAAIALPGASLGLGYNFAPCRALLDAGACLVIASDWNPGTAPMGDLLAQAGILAAYEKLSTAEVLAGTTFRAAHVLGFKDRGKIQNGYLADIAAFPTHDYREIFYHQGTMKALKCWKGGNITGPHQSGPVTTN